MTATNFMASLITVSGNPGLSFFFAYYDSEFGCEPSALQMMQEPLVTPGVDGIRYLDDHREPRIFQALTYEDQPDHTAAKALAAQYQLSRSSYANLYVANTNTTMRVKIKSVTAPQATDEGSPKAVAASLAGRGTTPGWTGVVIARWTFHMRWP